MKSLTEITLYDLMAEDLDVWVSKNKEFGFDLQLDDENQEPLIDEKGIHPYAAEGLADFCRRYLTIYDHIKESQDA